MYNINGFNWYTKFFKDIPLRDKGNPKMKSEKKRLISFILAVLMVSSLAAPALADVFALVELSSPETEPLVAATPEGDLTVTVRYGPDASIPDGSTLAVTPVDEEEKSKYMESGLSVIGGGKAVVAADGRCRKIDGAV